MFQKPDRTASQLDGLWEICLLAQPPKRGSTQRDFFAGFLDTQNVHGLPRNELNERR